MGALRTHLRGWARHHHGLYRIQKEQFQHIVTTLDTQAEQRTLTEGEREQLENARDDLTKLLREEELRFYQRAKVNDVVLGIIIPSISRWWQMANIGKNEYFP
jgi:hypothetical protein